MDEEVPQVAVDSVAAPVVREARAEAYRVVAAAAAAAAVVAAVVVAAANPQDTYPPQIQTRKKTCKTMSKPANNWRN